MHDAQAASEQQLLGIEQLIQLFAGLLPGDNAGHSRGGGGQYGKQQRQAQAQAQAGKSFHASPEGIADAVDGTDKVAAELAAQMMDVNFHGVAGDLVVPGCRAFPR